MTHTSSCPRADLVQRVVDGHASDADLSHVDSCAGCRAAVVDADRLRGALEGAAAPSIEAEASTAARDRMWREIDQRERTRRAQPALAALALAAVAVAALAGVFLFRAPSPASPTPAPETPALATPDPRPGHGTVHTYEGTVVTEIGTAPDEIVRLREGSITVEVSPLGEGERFRVIVGDGEVEVRGTAFDVTAVEDRLVEVRVLHGVVDVRPEGRPQVTLTAGMRWSAGDEPDGVQTAAVDESPHGGDEARAERPARPTRDAEAAPTPAGDRAPQDREANDAPAEDEPTAAPPATDPAAAWFTAGYAALQRGDVDIAQRALGRVMQEAPESPFAEDATYWAIVAHQRAGSTDAAREAAERFVDRYDTSSRVGEVSLLLGGWYAEAGDAAAARAALERALNAPDRRVRDAAAAALEALGAR